MFFCIQASNPRFQAIMNPNDECLAEAIESTFPLFTENAILVWNHISVPLSYKYDISYMINDILTLMNMMQKVNIGEWTIHWLPDSFRSDWFIKWNRDDVQIVSQFNCRLHFNKIETFVLYNHKSERSGSKYEEDNNL